MPEGYNFFMQKLEVHCEYHLEANVSKMFELEYSLISLYLKLITKLDYS